MKPKAVLLAAILVSIQVPAAAAEEPGTDKRVASDSKKGLNTPEYKLDFKELFGCEPMGEDGHPMSHEAAGGPETGKQEVPQAAGESNPVK